MYPLHTIVEGSIERLAFGGKGLLRTAERFVVFVPFTIPGERVRCRITQVKKNFAEAELVEILEKSPDRISPRCPYFGTCGGCQLQHMAYPLHIDYKRASVQEAVRRIYPEATISMEPTDDIWGYRRHISWTIKSLDNVFKAGYIGTDHRSLVQVKECPIFLAEPDPIFKKVSNLIGLLNSTRDPSGKVMIVKTSRQSVLLLFHFKELPKNFRKVFEKALDNEIEGIHVQSPQGESTYGQLQLSFELDQLQFQYHPAAFIQNHPEESARIYRYLQALVAKKKPTQLLDLYCGIGVSALLSARHAGKIEGVEWNRKAIELARENAIQNGISNVNFHANAVEAILPKLLKKSPDMAIVNPPRTGLKPSVSKDLAASSLQEIIYISCQPATLARDLKHFKEAGFLFEEGKAFDMFPQTGHVESLLHLKRLSA